MIASAICRKPATRPRTRSALSPMRQALFPVVDRCDVAHVRAERTGPKPSGVSGSPGARSCRCGDGRTPSSLHELAGHSLILFGDNDSKADEEPSVDEHFVSWFSREFFSRRFMVLEMWKTVLPRWKWIVLVLLLLAVSAVSQLAYRPIGPRTR